MNKRSQTQLSIIMPAYNAESFIKETIKSILEQTYSNFHLIIVNDGSTDHTLEVCEEFHDSRISIINIRNQGIISAFNLALEKINTKYVARIDSDDIYFKEKLERQIDFLENNPDTIILGTDAFYMSEKGKISKLRIKVPEVNKIIIENLLMRKRAIIQSTIIARTDILKKIDGYRENVYPEDYDLFFRASQYGKINNLSEPLAGIRIHNSFSHKNLKQLIEGHQKLIGTYNEGKIKINSSSSIYLNRMSLYYFLNKSKILGIMMLFLSVLISPIKTVKIFFKKIFIK